MARESGELATISIGAVLAVSDVHAPSVNCMLLPQLAAVTLRLAQSWGDAAAVRTAPVRRQAYLTAALVEAVGRLGAGPLEGHPGLLPALLAGVSTRLESPLPPVR